MVTAARDERVQRALRRGHLVDITTTGRSTGAPRRIEIVFHNLDGRIVISGMPGRPRAWLANLRADPRLTFHLKGAVTADLPATAREITDRSERAELLGPIAAAWRMDHALMVATSPLIEVSFDGG